MLFAILKIGCISALPIFQLVVYFCPFFLLIKLFVAFELKIEKVFCCAGIP